ncbi:SPW repeat protein [Haloterrigena turkmenica DSM 5511]|uniref:SPW repeat protein n=1 Tax=Haloterrigena turkmenica (strain ATCC 51198 / DSM 5511 / JCM 9101 / NCIMB 13204 / VKM B-1734 / 4k) TaxID=543526 RepID=D2RSR2_HALTV|nr:SPW repeat protein [Haloterrigena turkmenica]ADB60838.1 SPW repeat protein [Haloterrigena turkmenica DSM 5511]
MSTSRTTDARSPLPERLVGLAAAIGAWILWSGVVLTATGLVVVNNAVFGAAIAFFAAYTAGWPDGGRLPSIAAPALVVLLGLWVVAAPFVLEVTLDRVLWSNVIAGALVALLAAGSIVGGRRSTGSATASA